MDDEPRPKHTLCLETGAKACMKSPPRADVQSQSIQNMQTNLHHCIQQWLFLKAGEMTLNLEVHVNSEVHSDLWQSIPMGQKSSQPPQNCPKTQHKPPEQQKINQKKHGTKAKGPYPNPKKANKLKKDPPQKKTAQNTRISSGGTGEPSTALDARKTFLFCSMSHQNQGQRKAALVASKRTSSPGLLYGHWEPSQSGVVEFDSTRHISGGSRPLLFFLSLSDSLSVFSSSSLSGHAVPGGAGRAPAAARLRQDKLEEAFLFSGQFLDALHAMVDWFYKVEPQLAEDRPVHGDLDLVMILMDAHKIFQKELGKRTGTVQVLKCFGQELIEKSRDDMTWVKVQLQELSDQWDMVCELSVSKQTRLEQALKQAEEFTTAVHVLLEWFSEAEQSLRFQGVLPDNAEDLQSLIDAHKEFMKKVEEKRVDVNEAVGMGEVILATCHPVCMTTIKHWLTIIRDRFSHGRSNTSRDWSLRLLSWWPMQKPEGLDPLG
ncbi:uncharacterized protein O3Q21_008071 [Podargus strigoides]